MANPVLILTRHYSPEPTGSAPVLQQTAEWLARNGQAVEVVTVRPNYPEGRIFAGYEHGQHDDSVENGVRVRRWPTWPVKGTKLLARALPEMRFMVELLAARTTGRLRPSRRVISLCPSILTVLGALPLKAKGGRHVAIIHDIQSGLGSAIEGGSPIMSLLRRVEVFALNRVDHMVVLSHAMERALRELGVTAPAMVVPPHIDVRGISPLPRPEGAPPTLMYSGNLGRKQGLGQLLDLAAILRTEAPDVRILVRGDGAMRAELVAQAESQGLDNIRFEGLVAQSEVGRSLSEGDVHLVPQLAGGREFAVPSKAFAIMAAGRPFVATADAGSPLHDLAQTAEACVCTEAGDARAFADAALGLLRDPDARAHMGVAGRAYVEREAATDVVMSRILALFD